METVDQTGIAAHVLTRRLRLFGLALAGDFAGFLAGALAAFLAAAGLALGDTCATGLALA